ncbi:MAG: putative metallopeptidase [Candidatus Aenigmarchaeota archaeon]|nr:putative metallopeptidase [Candidatus Aenigmarchaeota archaeon]
MKYEKAPDVEERLKKIVKKLNQTHVDVTRVVCIRSYGSKSKAIARIWGLPKIFQIALDCSSYYVIEVIAKKYDKLSEEEKDKILIHELLHIPKKFSGSLLPHKYFNKKIDKKTVEELYKILIIQ